MKKDRVLLVAEAAALLGVQPSTIYQWAHKQKRGWVGGVKVYKNDKGDGKLYVRRSDCEKFLSQYRAEGLALPDYIDPDSPWMDDPGDLPVDIVTTEPKGGE